MLGLFTRPVGLVLAVMHGLFWFVGPLYSAVTLDHYALGARGGGDETVTNCFFFLYLSAAGGGAWSLDRRRDPNGEAAADSRWEPYAMGIMRIMAGFFFFNHGLEKWFGVSGRPGNINLTSLRGVAGFLELTGGSLLMLGLFARPMAFILSGMMAVAYFQFHWKFQFDSNFFPAINHGELAVVYCFVFLYIACKGTGSATRDG